MPIAVRWVQHGEVTETLATLVGMTKQNVGISQTVVTSASGTTSSVLLRGGLPPSSLTVEPKMRAG